MSLDNEIIEILSKYVSLSAQKIRQRVNKEYRHHYNVRTIQRHLKVLMEKGAVKPNPPTGIERTYSLSQKPMPMSEFFINQFWKRLDHIIELNAEDSSAAFHETRALCKTIPSLYKQLEPDIEEADKIILEWEKKHGSGPVKGGQGWITTPYEPLRGCLAVEDLVGKIAIFLHEQFERLQKSEKT